MAWNYDPKNWCDRAQEMRSIAERLKDAEAKAKMLRVAADYERSPKQQSNGCYVMPARSHGA
jgi:hypothetical protein